MLPAVLKVGDKIPEFTAQTADGKTVLGVPVSDAARSSREAWLTLRFTRWRTH